MHNMEILFVIMSFSWPSVCHRVWLPRSCLRVSPPAWRCRATVWWLGSTTTGNGAESIYDHRHC